MFKVPKNDDRYHWTRHVVGKMKFYGISPDRVKRIIRFPNRTEEGIIPGAVAVMQPTSIRRTTEGKPDWKQEIWVMYKLVKQKDSKNKKIKIITAWRYPGKSPKRDPIPLKIIQEIRSIL